MIKESTLAGTVKVSGEALKSGLDKTYLELADYLSHNKIRYVVVHRYYEGRREGGVEFIVAPKALRLLKSYILQFCRARALMLVQRIWQQATSCLYIIADYDPVLKTTLFYRLRFSSAFNIPGNHSLASGELLEHKTYICGTKTWQLTKLYAFTTTFLQCIAAKKVDRELFQELSSLWNCGKSSIIILLKRFLHKEGIDLVSRSFDEEDYPYFNTHLGQIHANCLSNKFKKIANNLFYSVNVLRNIYRPSGLVVGILGRDGVGKSAVCAVLTHSLASAFKDVVSFKRHPKVFYNGHLFKKSADYHFTKPHLYRERGYFASFIKLILLFDEFLIGYWLKVFPFKRRASLILYDRYFLDILADPLRYRIKGNKWLIKMMHGLLPKPDVWIILDLPTNILLQRKQELTYEMSEKLREAYLSLPNMLSNCKVITNEGQLDKTVECASAFIIDYMTRRYHKGKAI